MKALNCLGQRPDPQPGDNLDLAKDSVSLTVEDAENRYEIFSLDSESISDEDRAKLIRIFNDDLRVFGDVEEIALIKKNFGI